MSISSSVYKQHIKEKFDDKSTTIFDNDGAVHSIALIAFLYSNAFGNLRIYVDKAEEFVLSNPYLNYLLRKAIEERKLDVKIIIREEIIDASNYLHLNNLNLKSGIVLNVEGEDIKNFITMDNEALRIEKTKEQANGCFYDPVIVGALNNLFMEHFK